MQITLQHYPLKANYSVVFKLFYHLRQKGYCRHLRVPLSPDLFVRAAIKNTSVNIYLCKNNILEIPTVAFFLFSIKSKTDRTFG